MRIHFMTLAALLCLDQLSKYWARNQLPWLEPISLAPVLDLMLGYNRGAAFSILDDGYWWQYWFLLGSSILVSAILVVFLLRSTTEYSLRAWGVTILLAGALGNLVDRALYAQVTDFISLHWGAHYFPTFNFADSMISVGVVMLLVDVWYGERAR